MIKRLTTFSLLILSLSGFAQIPTNGLVAWWPFTGNAVDSVNQYNNGTVYGATLTTDRHGNSNSAYYFDGNGDYIDVGTHSSIRGGTHTLSFWFKYSKTSSTMQIVSNFNSYNGEWGSAALANATTGLQYNAGSGGSGKNMLHQSFTRLADNQWHLFTAMFDDSRNILSVYFDDDLSGGVNYVAGGHFSASDSLYFKANEHWIFGAASMYFSTSKNNGPQYYEGSLDDVRMYDRMLTTTEVLKIYHEGSFNVDSTVYDTVEYAVFDTTFVTHYDTAQIWDTIYSTVYDTSRVWDTTYTTIYDTIWEFDTITYKTFDTTFITAYDTQVVAVTDTLYIDVDWGSTKSDFIQAKLYPNPTKDKITIDFGNFTKVVGYKVRIYNISGQQLFEGTVANKVMQIDLSTLGADGLYTLHIVSDTGNIKSIKQIILQ